MTLDTLLALVSLTVSRRLYGQSPSRQTLFRRRTAAWLDECFFAIVDNCAAEGFLECGAHEAAASIRFARATGKQAVAVEANPLTYEQKTRAAERDGVVVLNCGVSAAAGEIDFHIPKVNTTSGNASTLRRPGVESSTIKVPAVTVDEIYAKYFPAGEQIALWVDVEGAGLSVLKGAESMLRAGRCKILKLEMESRQFWQQQPLATEVDAFVCSLGYTPVLRDIEYEEQFNAIYVHASVRARLDEVLMRCWRDLSRLRLGAFEGRTPITEEVAHYKRRLLGSGRGPVSLAAHRLAAILGSQSSKQFLRGGKGALRL